MSVRRGQLEELETRLGHRFADQGLLRRAITHSSTGATAALAYERLEFLGDRVLGLVIAETLLRRFADEPEGAMTRRLASLVSRDTLAAVARRLDLGRFLVIPTHRHDDALRSRDSVLADALEAVIAGVYLDAGLEAARGLVLRHWSTQIDLERAPPVDPKSALQEWALGRRLATPDYEVIECSGPPHAPVFTIQVTVRGHPPQTATGPSKRKAELTAAAQLLSLVTGAHH
ncbi:MAG: ribonuclease III [Alphaproteobacteria bacterium]|nr:ribonuclease III [Alphaproteobacteria bacterium]